MVSDIFLFKTLGVLTAGYSIAYTVLAALTLAAVITVPPASIALLGGLALITTIVAVVCFFASRNPEKQSTESEVLNVEDKPNDFSPSPA